MQIRTFRAKNLPSALAKVREELGPDAAVLETRPIAARWTSMWNGSRVEVTASSGTTHKTPSTHSMPEAPVVDVETPQVASEVSLTPSIDANLPKSEAMPVAAIKPTTVHRQTDELEMLTAHTHEPPALAGRGQLPTVLFGIYNELLDAGVDASWAKQLIQVAQQGSSREEWNDPWSMKSRMVQWVQQQIPLAKSLDAIESRNRQVVALVGPTGVGKTTTLAKLAAGLTLDHRISVGMITVDTFRIGAVDQLRRYAEIMHLPMRVVENESQMNAACQELANCDVTLIDTAGRTPRDSEQLSQLERMLAIAAPTQTHLVLSATSAAGSYRNAFQRFAITRPNRLILSKLDEAAGAGTLLPQLSQSSLPISYVTTGQNVPHDIQAANRTRLGAFLLGQCDCV